MKCEISVEELEQLLEENEKSRELLISLAVKAGADVEKYMKKEPEGEQEVNLGIPIMPSKMMKSSAERWKMIADFLTDEIGEYEESFAELRSLKRISRTADEYEETENEVKTSGELINGLQTVISAIQKRDRIRRGEE